METQTIEDQIFALFIQLSAARQAVLADTLSFATEEEEEADGINVEEVAEEYEQIRVEPQNEFSASLKLPATISDAVLTLCRLSAQTGKPIFMEMVADDSQIGTYAIAVAVSGDPKKIAQLIAIVKSWQ